MPNDFSYFGSDITVLPDLDENEQLVSEIDCVAQDLLNGWSQPTGIADLTDAGLQWGVDLQSYLNAGLTPDMIFALKVALEFQAERDDRIEKCTVNLTVDRSGVVSIAATVYLGPAPYLLTYTLTAGTLALLQVQELS